MAGAFEYLNSCFPQGMTKVAHSLGYPEETVNILNSAINTDDELADMYPDIYARLITCEHQCDTRSILAYSREIIAAWVAEDTILNKLKAAGMDAYLSGTDAERELLRNTGVKASADMTVRIGDHKQKVELVCDYTGFWTKKRKIHLRDHKLYQLARSDADILCIDMRNKQFYLFSARDVEGSMAVTHLSKHPVWAKPAEEISLDADASQDLILRGKDSGEAIRDALIYMHGLTTCNQYDKTVDSAAKEAYTIYGGNKAKCAQFVPYIPVAYRQGHKVDAVVS